VLDRWLVRRTDEKNRVFAMDTHRTLLHEAIALARQEEQKGLVTFQAGHAEALPFRNSAFIVLSSTVMELLDADQMLREMIRVTKPGGRVEGRAKPGGSRRNVLHRLAVPLRRRHQTPTAVCV
jgi:ubiquinone/menaquinone biosynthesis C-methylase UbiE